jgi:hypothetical protein
MVTDGDRGGGLAVTGDALAGLGQQVFIRIAGGGDGPAGGGGPGQPQGGGAGAAEERTAFERFHRGGDSGSTVHWTTLWTAAIRVPLQAARVTPRFSFRGATFAG